MSVKITKDNSTISETTTNANGEYSINVQVGDEYIIEFLKTGYITVSYENVQIAAFTDTHLEPVLQIDQSYSGIGNIEGKIINSLNGAPVPNLDLNLRKGINKKTGMIINTSNTDTDGLYRFIDVEVGNYTVELGGTGYTTTYFSVICIGGRTTGNQDATISPVLNPNEYRIILSWGKNPLDIDSHLTGPTPDEQRFHTFYRNLEYSYLDEVYANLDRDDVDSYGPETTTILKKLDGLYRFSIHDYTNRHSDQSTALSNSNAHVRVYKGSELAYNFYVPTNEEGTLWTVFEMFDDSIVPKNIMSYESDPRSIRKVTIDETDADIIRDLPDKNP